MTLDAYIDRKYAAPVASNNGWRIFAKWLRSTKNAALKSLADTGTSGDLPKLKRALKHALQDNPPVDAASLDVGVGLLKAIDTTAEVLVISDGTN